jgi:hypothetical protein
VSQSSEANTLTFQDTPIKQVVVDGKWSKGVIANDVDSAKGTIYFSETSPDQFAIAVLNRSITPATEQILTATTVGGLSATQLSELMSAHNPTILRYCAERGKPKLMQVGKKKLLVNSFSQEERLHIATAQGAVCTPAVKYEAHAFAVANKKLVHIYLVRPVSAEKQDSLLNTISEKFDSILSKIEWE